MAYPFSGQNIILANFNKIKFNKKATVGYYEYGSDNKKKLISDVLLVGSIGSLTDV